MVFAMDELKKKLESTGMNDEEINHILAKFLYEEAFSFVDYYEHEMKKMELEAKQRKEVMH